MVRAGHSAPREGKQVSLPYIVTCLGTHECVLVPDPKPAQATWQLCEYISCVFPFLAQEYLARIFDNLKIVRNTGRNDCLKNGMYDLVTVDQNNKNFIAVYDKES